jgi:hypothetical protein
MKKLLLALIFAPTALLSKASSPVAPSPLKELVVESQIDPEMDKAMLAFIIGLKKVTAKYDKLSPDELTAELEKLEKLRVELFSHCSSYKRCSHNFPLKLQKAIEAFEAKRQRRKSQ